MSDFILKAKQLASKSTMSHKHGCVIVKNGDIISTGINKYINYFEHQYSIHAEVDAINKIKRKGKKFLINCDVYIVRISNYNNDILRLSHPCLQCTRVLLKYGVRRIFYSVDTDEYSVEYKIKYDDVIGNIY